MVSWALENCQFTVMPALLVQHKPVKSSELDACGLWVDCSLWQTLCSTLIPTPVMVQGEKLWNWELGDWVPLDVLVLISFMTLGKSHCLWALASFWAVFSECFKRSCNFPLSYLMCWRRVCLTLGNCWCTCAVWQEEESLKAGCSGSTSFVFLPCSDHRQKRCWELCGF